MKTAIFILFIFCAAAALAQTAPVLPNQTQILRLPEHPEHASVHDMAQEQPIVGGTMYSYAQGERPLWEFGPVAEPLPLGDVARAYRKEKLSMKKAAIVFEKQGS